MLTRILIALLILIASTYGVHYRGYKDGEKQAKLEAQAATVIADRTYRAKEQSLNTKLQKAQDDAQERETELLHAALIARNQSERLRSNITAIRSKLSSLTDAAVRQYADTASVVFDECQRNYSSLAAEADRLDSDKQTLIEAWPR